MKNPEAARMAKAGLSGPASAVPRATAGALITRRGLLGTLAALVAAPFVPVPAPVPPLAFHKDAFALMMADVVPVTLVNRFDVLYGVGYFREPIMCRIEGA